MIFETLKTEGLAHLSYLLGDRAAGVCAVIDPRRDVDVYLDLSRHHHVRITHILETHVHADFVSGSRELSARTGAAVYVGAGVDYGFDVQPLDDGDRLEVGPVSLEVVHTPGHAPEHVSYVVSGGGKGAEHAWGVFTGDALFAGEVGRPDLAGDDARGRARRLYRALTDRLLPLGDGVEVYPAHGPGSPCGTSIGVRDRTTIGYERLHNDRLKAADADAFADAVVAGLTQEPFYYRRLKKVNAEGPPLLGALPHVPALTPGTFEAAMERNDAVVVDTREIEAFGGAHIPGSINIALRRSFPLWAGWMLDPDRRILLVAESAGDAVEAQGHLLRIGCDHVAGWLHQGLRSWIESGRAFETMGRMSVRELHRRIERDGDGLQVVDVRAEDEWAAGHVPTAHHAFVPFLTDHLDALDPNRPVAVYCGSGYRASLAGSLLKRNGFTAVHNVPGSMDAWKAAGLPLVA